MTSRINTVGDFRAANGVKNYLNFEETVNTPSNDQVWTYDNVLDEVKYEDPSAPAPAAFGCDIAIGENALTTTQGTAVGCQAEANDTQSCAYGYDCVANGVGSISIGNNNTVSSDNAICIGGNSAIAGEDAIAIGDNVAAGAAEAISIGTDSFAGTYRDIAIGAGSHAQGSSGGGTTAIGTYVQNTIDNSVALGGYNSGAIGPPIVRWQPSVTVNQQTSNSTTVAQNASMGAIQMFGVIAANTTESFTFANTHLWAPSTVVFAPICNGTVSANLVSIGSGTCVVNVNNNNTTGATTNAPTLYYQIWRCAV